MIVKCVSRALSILMITFAPEVFGASANDAGREFEIAKAKAFGLAYSSSATMEELVERLKASLSLTEYEFLKDTAQTLKSAQLPPMTVKGDGTMAFRVGRAIVNVKVLSARKQLVKVNDTELDFSTWQIEDRYAFILNALPATVRNRRTQASALSLFLPSAFAAGQSVGASVAGASTAGVSDALNSQNCGELNQLRQLCEKRLVELNQRSSTNTNQPRDPQCARAGEVSTVRTGSSDGSPSAVDVVERLLAYRLPAGVTCPESGVRANLTPCAQRLSAVVQKVCGRLPQGPNPPSTGGPAGRSRLE